LSNGYSKLIKLEKFLRVAWITLVLASSVMHGLDRYESEVNKYGFALRASLQNGSLIKLSARPLKAYGTGAYVSEFSHRAHLDQVGEKEFDLEMYDLMPFAQIFVGEAIRSRVIHESNIYRFWEEFVGANQISANLDFNSAEMKKCKVRVSMRNAEYVISAKAIVASISVLADEDQSASAPEKYLDKCSLESGPISALSLTYGLFNE